MKIRFETRTMGWSLFVTVAFLLAGPALGQETPETPAEAETEAQNDRTTGDKISSMAAATMAGQEVLGAASGAPDATSATPIDPQPTDSDQKQGRGTFVAVPYPISNPTFGTGLQAIAVYIRPLRASDTVSPPSVFALGGFYTDSGSWLGAAGGKLFLFQDRLRIVGGFAPYDLRYDYYGTGNEAGEDGLAIPIQQEGLGYLLDALVAVAGRFYVGMGFSAATIETRLDLDSLLPDLSLPELPLEIPDRDTDVALAALRFLVQRDSRDDQFFPVQGSLLDLVAKFNDESLGSDFSFQSYSLEFNRYFGLRDRRDVLAVRGALCDVEGDAPFFSLCTFGSNNDLRGYVSGRYRDEAMFAVQVEYRRQISARWGAVLFGGVGEVAPSIGDFSLENPLPGGGVGIRFAPSKKQRLNLRVDYAWGKDGGELYLSLGEAF